MEVREKIVKGVTTKYRYYSFSDVNIDPVIPVVIVFPWRKKIFENEEKTEILLVRRSFNVGSYKGLWAPIAGVDDRISPQKDQSDNSIFTVVNEMEEEVGIKNIEGIVLIGEKDNCCIQMAGRIWRQKIYAVEVSPRDPVYNGKITINSENIGATWVDYDNLLIALEGRFLGKDCLPSRIVLDGIAPDFGVTIDIFDKWIKTGLMSID